MKITRKCSVCGKQITEGYVFDGTDCFCSKECAVECFDGDEGCFEILVDEGNRLLWLDSLQTAPHYKVGIGADNPNNFFYCDTKEKVFAWINSKVFQTVNDWHDIETYNESHEFAKIDVILFNPRDYYKHRRQYIILVKFCDTIMSKAQLTMNDTRKRKLLHSFAINYDDANWLKDVSPEVWQGEI